MRCWRKPTNWWSMRHITTDNFREFVCTNWPGCTSLNPDFFTGTVVEEAVAKLVPPATGMYGSYATENFARQSSHL